MDRIFAHSLPGEPLDRWETLREHSLAVARLAGEFAARFGWAAVAEAAGLLHDLGKLSAEFQAYIRSERLSGGDHSTAGARIARDLYREKLGAMIAAIIAGHHAGLSDAAQLAGRLAAPSPFSRRACEAAIGVPPELRALLPTRRQDLDAGPENFARHFLLRMLFSCLVDADFLATEAFYTRSRGERVDRGGHLAIGELRDRLARFMAAKHARADTNDLNALRADILDHAIAKAALPPGLFTLTVPTGGGKTLASLSFALEHAVAQGLRRVIYVILRGSADRNPRSMARGRCAPGRRARKSARPASFATPRPSSRLKYRQMIRRMTTPDVAACGFCLESAKGSAQLAP